MRRCGSLQNLILERHAFRVVFLELCLRGVRISEHFQVVAVANVLARVDIDPDGHWSLFSLRSARKNFGSRNAIREFFGAVNPGRVYNSLLDLAADERT